LAASSEAIYETGPHWVAEREHDNWNRAGCILRGLRGLSGVNGYNIRVEAHTFCREGGKSLPMSLSGKVVDGNGSLIRIAKIAQSLEERFKLVRPQRSWIKRKETEPRDILGLLCARRKRACCRAAEQRDELASPHGHSLGARITPYHIVEKPCCA
jgi:hypothetical protein